MKASCVICTEAFSESDKISVLTCGHVYHENCILEWMNNSHLPTCPECRKPFARKSLARLYLSFSAANKNEASLHNEIAQLTGTISIQKVQLDLNMAEKSKLLNDVQEANQKVALMIQKIAKLKSDYDKKMKEYFLLSEETIKLRKAEAASAIVYNLKIKELEAKVQELTEVNKNLSKREGMEEDIEIVSEKICAGPSKKRLRLSPLDFDPDVFVCFDSRKAGDPILSNTFFDIPCTNHDLPCKLAMFHKHQEIEQNSPTNDESQRNTPS